MARSGSVRPSGAEKPLRYACDRCHAQKLRCLRAHVADELSQKEPCLRCQKAHTPCIISAANKVGRPPKSSNKKSRASSASSKSSETAYTASRRFVLGVDGDSSKGLTRGQQSAQPFNANENVSMFNPNQLFGLPQLTAQNQVPFPVMSDSGVSMSTATPITHSLSSISGEDLEEKDEDFEDLGQELSMWPNQEDYPGYDCLSLGPIIGSMPGVNERGIPHYPEMYGDMYKNGSLIGYPASSASFHAQGLVLGSTSQVDPIPSTFSKEGGLDTVQTQHGSGAQAVHAPGSPSTSGFSSGQACLERLADLNLNLLRLSEKTRVTTGQALKAAAGRENEVISEMVQFARELIDLVPRIIPMSHTNRVSTVGQSSSGALHRPHNLSSNVGGSYHGLNSGTCSQYDSVLHSPIGDFTGMDSPTDSMPGSTMILLVMGCYTQIMYVFETIINCLCQDHRPTAGSAGQSCGESSLETSLHIHTITYLLKRLHEALYAYPPDTPLDPAIDNILYDVETNLRSQDPSRTTQVFGKGVAGGLLGRASCEIRQREQTLMQNIQSLSRLVSGSRYS
ncbi:hypothetical protein BO71DRAFT_405130 [Aspergillus ellipticus CBS 707.79]|uniref:Zn(2)-C6 fungal-type domain-containing protein n=1 Tax=Aspergillus ellipticus CBS 707.79 TaxID=1448320 RepID=A0A319E037_9EURO|nr:hypothetical protein BO71DRAFT_405130 [Aspergillus ellipticus CBS 707.79]